MKTIFSLKISSYKRLMLLSWTFAVIISCSKDNNSEITYENASLNESNKIVYNANGNSPTTEAIGKENFVNTHISKIVTLGNNQERESFLNILLDNGIDINSLAIEEIKKTSFDNRDLLELYSIHFINNSEDGFIVYNYNGIYIIKTATYTDRENGKKKLTVRTYEDNALVYSVHLEKTSNDNLYRYSKLMVNENETFEQFSTKVGSFQLASQEGSKTDSCCRRASGWRACTACTMQDLGIITMFGGWQLGVAISASCIGAGPNTFC